MEKMTDHSGFDRLMELMRVLRAPGGCPWDREQTHASAARNFLEEAYEFCEAAEQDDPVHMCEELGDVLSQVALHTCIEEEAGRFTIADVCAGISEKMIARHPHVFGSDACATSDEVLERWEARKREEKSQKTAADTLNAVAKNLPALWRAEKLARRAVRLGLTPEVPGAAERALGAFRTDGASEEALGELLFAICASASARGLDPERALHAACERFVSRAAAEEGENA